MIKLDEYIEIGNLNRKIFEKIGINLITEEVIFTLERIKHVEDRRQLYEEIKEILPKAIYSPEYIYKDWNNRNDTIVLIKRINQKSRLNIVIKVTIKKDEKHPKNSIITIIKIGEKTFRKIYKNKGENLLFEKLDKDE